VKKRDFNEDSGIESQIEAMMKRIVIIGDGFGALAAVKALRHARAEIWVIDRAHPLRSFLAQIRRVDLLLAQLQ